jgi:hypothetical protein
VSTQMGVFQLWTAESIAKSTAVTSAAIDIGKANALALHVTALTGTTPDVTFTYSLSNSREGTFVTPLSPATIKANAGAADVHDFAPEAAGFIKIIATNNSATNAAVLTAQLAVQEM